MKRVVRHSSLAIWVALLTIVLTAAGCGPPAKLRISGQLTKKGQPFQPPPKMMVSIVFLPEKKESERSCHAQFNYQNGTYTVEVPPGQYKTNLILSDKTKTPSVTVKISPEFSKKVYELTTSKTLDLEMEP